MTDCGCHRPPPRGYPPLRAGGSGVGSSVGTDPLAFKLGLVGSGGESSDLRAGGGGSCSGAAAQLRAIFYKSATSNTLQPWAKAYRDISKQICDVLAWYMPHIIPIQVILIDTLKKCDEEGLKAFARERATAFKWHGIIAGILAPIFVVLLPPAAPFMGAAAAINMALAQILEDYGHNRPISVNTLLRVVGGIAQLVGASGSLPPDVTKAMEEADRNPAVRSAVERTVVSNKPKGGTRLGSGDGKLSDAELRRLERAMGFPPGTMKRPPPAPTVPPRTPRERAEAEARAAAKAEAERKAQANADRYPGLTFPEIVAREQAIEEAKERARAELTRKAKENQAKYPGKTLNEIVELERVAVQQSPLRKPIPTVVKVGGGLLLAFGLGKAFKVF